MGEWPHFFAHAIAFHAKKKKKKDHTHQTLAFSFIQSNSKYHFDQSEILSSANTLGHNVYDRIGFIKKKVDNLYGFYGSTNEA